MHRPIPSSKTFITSTRLKRRTPTKEAPWLRNERIRIPFSSYDHRRWSVTNEQKGSKSCESWKLGRMYRAYVYATTTARRGAEKRIERERKRIGRSWCRAGLSLAGRLRNRASFFLHYESRQGIIVPVFTELFGTKGLQREPHSRIPFISGKAFTVRPWAARLSCLYALLELLSLLTKQKLSFLRLPVFCHAHPANSIQFPPLLSLSLCLFITRVFSFFLCVHAQASIFSSHTLLFKSTRTLAIFFMKFVTLYCTSLVWSGIYWSAFFVLQNVWYKYINASEYIYIYICLLTCFMNERHFITWKLY